MDKWQRWAQDEGGRSPITGQEIVMGPVAVDLTPAVEFNPIQDSRPRVYHAQLIVCDCHAILDVGESCEHLAFEAGPPARIRALVSGYRTITWRSFSPTEQPCTA